MESTAVTTDCQMHAASYRWVIDRRRSDKDVRSRPDNVRLINRAMSVVPAIRLPISMMSTEMMRLCGDRNVMIVVGGNRLGVGRATVGAGITYPLSKSKHRDQHQREGGKTNGKLFHEKTPFNWGEEN